VPDRFVIRVTQGRLTPFTGLAVWRDFHHVSYQSDLRRASQEQMAAQFLVKIGRNSRMRFKSRSCQNSVFIANPQHGWIEYPALKIKNDGEGICAMCAFELGEIGDWSLLIPYAFLADGQKAAPGNAVKGDQYSCPECKLSLFVREGPERRRHFAHRHENKNCPFVRDDRQYYILKHDQLFRFEQWLNPSINAPAPQFYKQCSKCRERFRRPIKDTIRGVKMDCPIVDDLMVDIALFDDSGQLLGGIIYDHKRRVSRAPFDKLIEMGKQAILIRVKEAVRLPYGVLPVAEWRPTLRELCEDCKNPQHVLPEVQSTSKSDFPNNLPKLQPCPAYQPPAHWMQNPINQSIRHKSTSTVRPAIQTSCQIDPTRLLPREETRVRKIIVLPFGYSGNLQAPLVTECPLAIEKGEPNGYVSLFNDCKPCPYHFAYDPDFMRGVSCRCRD